MDSLRSSPVAPPCGMGVPIEQWWASKPAVTQLVVMITVLVSLSSMCPPTAFSPSALLRPILPRWLLQLTISPVEFLLGCFLGQLFDAGGLGLPLLINTVVLAQVSQQIELDVFHGFTNDVMYFPRQELFAEDLPPPVSGRFSPLVSTIRYVWFLFVVGVNLVVVDVCLVHVRGCLPMALAYVWCRLQPASAQVALPFGAKVSARSYPILLAGIHFLMGQGLISDTVAVLIGHAFCYTLHVRRDDYLELGLRVFDVPIVVYARAKRLRLRRFERMRQQGRIM